MSTTPTHWPLRQALNFALRQLILTQFVPAINPYLTAQFTANDAPPDKIPQFGDANVVVGDVPVPGEPTLCVVGISRRNQILAAGLWGAYLTTQIRLKTPWVADDVPEDFEMLSSAVFDNLEDMLTSLANRTITPVNPASGAGMLPHKDDGGLSSFMECASKGSIALSYPVRSADGVTHYAGAQLSHTALYQYALARPGVVGT
jgi:hypothetical protein